MGLDEIERMGRQNTTGSRTDISAVGVRASYHNTCFDHGYGQEGQARARKSFMDGHARYTERRI